MNKKSRVSFWQRWCRVCEGFSRLPAGRQKLDGEWTVLVLSAFDAHPHRTVDPAVELARESLISCSS